MKKICLLLCTLLILSLLFPGCRKTPNYSVYDGLPGREYFDYLLMEREKVKKLLNVTEETWDYLYNADGSPSDSIWPKEPTIINGDPWMLQLRFYPDAIDRELDSPHYLDFFIFHREVMSDDYVVKNQAIADIYEFLKSQLGEPAEPYWPNDNRAAYLTIAEGLENGFSTEYYSDAWVLAEQIQPPKPFQMPKDEDVNLLLLLYLDVHCVPDRVEMKINYRVLDSRYSELADYTQNRGW
ncbi:MAG: hypothetical protein E7458_08355 [Ruminococcaceae bacterium]|nr:hypothetical protein [Oscillospiraceae bacterium]